MLLISYNKEQRSALMGDIFSAAAKTQRGKTKSKHATMSNVLKN
jgi:hypothetical protein